MSFISRRHIHAEEALPGSFYATTAERRFWTGPLVNKKAWLIRDIIKSPNNDRCMVRFQGRAPTPAQIPGGLIVRVDCGWNGLTLGPHPADQPDLTPWAVAAGMNDRWLELIGSVWEDNSVCIEAHAYEAGTAFDVAEAVNNMFEEIRLGGLPADVWAPPGNMHVISRPIRVTEGTIFRGAGMYNTCFLLADKSMQTWNPDPTKPMPQVFETGGGDDTTFRNVRGTEIRDIGIFVNRAHQVFQKSTVALAFGGLDGASPSLERYVIPSSFAIRRLLIAGSGGYGMQLSGDGIKRDIDLHDIQIRGADSDGVDFKNRAYANQRIWFQRVHVHHWSLGGQGTHLYPVINLPDNPIYTTLGSNRFGVPRSMIEIFINAPCAPGEVATFTDGGTVNGIPLSGRTYLCVARENMGTPAVACAIFEAIDLKTEEEFFGNETNDLGDGGAGIKIYMPHWQEGDVAIDVRGADVRLDMCYAEGRLATHGGFRVRKNKNPEAVGVEPLGCVMNGCKVRDVSDDRIGRTTSKFAGKAFSIAGEGVQLINPVLEGKGFCTALEMISTASHLQVMSPKFYKAGRGMLLSGNHVNVTGGVVEDCVDIVAQVHGSLTSDANDLAPNSFMPKAVGSNVVIVNSPNHGMVTGAQAGFVLENDPQNGLVVETVGAKRYPITVTDPNTYEFAATGAAIAYSVDGGPVQLHAFGGDENTEYPPLDKNNVAHDIHFNGLKISNSDPANTSRPFAIGIVEGGDLGQADDVTIQNCHDSGSNLKCLDYSATTVWQNNTGGLPNYPYADHPATWTLVDEQVADGVKGRYDFQHLDAPEVRLEFVDLTHGNVANQSLRIYASSNNCATLRNNNGEYVVTGVNSATSSSIVLSAIAGTPNGGWVEFTNFNRKERSYFSYAGGGYNPAVAVAMLTGGYLEARALFTVTGAAGGSLDTLTADGVALIDSVVPWVTDNNTTAQNIITEINSLTATHGYAAARSSNVISIFARNKSMLDDPKDTIALTTTGALQMVPVTTPDIEEEAFNGLTVVIDSTVMTAGKLRAYRRG